MYFAFCEGRNPAFPRIGNNKKLKKTSGKDIWHLNIMDASFVRKYHPAIWFRAKGNDTDL